MICTPKKTVRFNFNEYTGEYMEYVWGRIYHVTVEHDRYFVHLGHGGLYFDKYQYNQYFTTISIH